MLTVYGSPNTRSLRVTWMLEELAENYIFSYLDFSKGQSQSPEFLAINPAGKIPVLIDDGFVLTESAAIVSYLGDKGNKTQLVPEAGSKRRAKYDQWCHFAMSELEQPLWTMAKHKFAIPKQYRIAGIYPTAEWEFQKALNLLSSGLDDQDYILGEHFSAADILISHCLIWATSQTQAVSQSNLRAYLERIQQRPALLAAMQREQSAKNSTAIP